MFGLAVIGAFALYAVVSLVVIFKTASYAQKQSKRVWLWGLGAAFVMYNLVFWDWIPTVVAHKYYCEKEAGFWVYKTLDQWKKENPGVAETLVANKKVVTIKNAYVLNQRFNWVIKQEQYFPLNYMMREEQQVVDSKTGEVLASYVDFSASQQRRQAGWSGWKMWLDSPHCSGGEMNDSRLYHFFSSAKHISEEEKK